MTSGIPSVTTRNSGGSLIRTVGAWSVALALAGACQGIAIAGLLHLGWGPGLAASARFAVASLVWVPVAIAATVMWRSRRAPRSVALWLVAGSLYSLLAEPKWFALVNPFGSRASAAVRTLVRADTNLLFFVAILAVTWLAESRRRQVRAELAAARLEASLVDLQLHVLTLQLHPHFLFNALNLISQLAYENLARALETLENLRQLLLESIVHAAQRAITLAEELRFVRAYVDIQRSRFGSQLTMAIDCDEAAGEAGIPHLLLQPIVENAILHGLAGRGGAGHVEVVARVHGDRVVIAVRDDGVGASAPLREGLGLSNTRARLLHFYGSDHRFELRARHGGGTEVVVDIPRRPVRVQGVENADDQADAPELRQFEGAMSMVALRAPRWVWIAGGWFVIAMIWTLLEGTAARVGGMPFDIGDAILGNTLNAVVWMALTPAIIALGVRRSDPARSFRPAVVAAGWFIAVAAHLVAWLTLLALIVPARYASAIGSIVGWALWDVAAVAGLIAFASAVSLIGQFQGVRVAMERANVRIGQAKLASLRLRLQPSILVTGLDAVRDSLSCDVVRAESVIARMGDLLRLLLDSASSELATLTDEMTMFQAYTDVVGEPAGMERNARPRRWKYEPIDTTVPAGSFSALAAAVGGSVDRVWLYQEAETLHFRILSEEGEVREGLLDALQLRLESLCEGSARVAARPTTGGTELALAVPLARENTDAPNDETAFAAEWI